MKKVRFIANPFSGAVRNRNLRQTIESHLDPEQFEYELCYTERAGHAILLAAEAVAGGFDLVVACGGDGSVNEVASALVGSQTVLGVLPCGSGNGFAMHLGIGRNVPKAVEHLNSGVVILVDTCRLSEGTPTENERFFVNLSGIGFDGVVANCLHADRRRGLLAYLRHSLRETWRYEMQPFDIQIDELKIRHSCLLVEVANAPIYGYGFAIVPPARPDDGLLEVLVAKAAPKWRYLLETWRFLNHSFHRSPLVECYTGKEVIVTPARPTGAHVDGEGFCLAGSARFGIVPKSLRVLVPRVHAELLKPRLSKF